MTKFTLRPVGPFSLEPIRGLMCGFLRGTRSCDARGETVKLAFPVDGTFEVAGVSLALGDGMIEGDVARGHDVGAVARQVARVLAVDRDARPFDALLRSDVVLRAIGDARPGFRPVVAYSPYVMGAWSVLSQRLRMSQAAALQVRIAEASGDFVEIAGDRVASFPRPKTILDRTSFPGIQDEKWKRLRALAAAAMDGELELDRLTSVPYAEARDRLRRIRGVGPWTADAILIRGCGPSDVLPLGEPTLNEAVARAYGLAAVPSDDEVSAIAEAWRPFRTWVSVLVISHHWAGAGTRAGGRARGGRRAA
jgi:DNA-3-methyladenine glycosylase II